MEKRVRAIKLEAKKEAEECYLNTDLKSLQEAVGGYIEQVYPFESDDILLLCNEEGKLTGMEISRAILDNDNTILDVIAGTCYIMALDDEGNYRDLTDMELAYYIKKMKYPIEIFVWEYTDNDGIKRRNLDFIPRNNKGRKVKYYGR